MSRKGRKSNISEEKLDDVLHLKNGMRNCALWIYRSLPDEIVFIINSIVSVITWLIDRSWRIMKRVFWIHIAILDWLVSGAFLFALFKYWEIVGRFPAFLHKYEQAESVLARLKKEVIEIKDEAKSYAKLAKQENKRLEKTLSSEQRERKYAEKRNKELESYIDKLNNEKDQLEMEKKRALQRLSAQVCVKLRDNNPNIADLNDEFRPTKLAEMFCELYDNEWTNAFALLESCFGEQLSIKVLLDIVMEAYAFCETKVAEPWAVLDEWFLDKNIKGAQNTIKWLKDSRKVIVRRKVSNIQKEYECELLSACKKDDLKELLLKEPMKLFIAKCIELCLLMTTTDPPIVMDCPLREPFLKLSTKNFTEIDNDCNGRNVGPQMQKVHKKSLINDENASSIDRQKCIFDKDSFKEYTCRGKYLDFVVWPALLLYKGGPMLNKGVAQGRKTH
ncbi:uncharacterized protein LOC132715857 [Ruditapes philippinarum]|uniref:uncharacterized protein LOC132715857 n=1 Tax=Ruditapes philippinarum TaxID=129788 RepID=UPI00295B420F|nr:uncharacterized protein LOC132715857 [Ruditapes philippinarum]